MKKKKMLTCICALMLTAGLIAGGAVPAFAAASEEPAAGKVQVMEESIAEEEIGFTEDTEEEPEVAPVSEEEPEIAPVSEEEPEIAPVSEEEPEIAPISEEEPEIAPVSEEKEDQGVLETVPVTASEEVLEAVSVTASEAEPETSAEPEGTTPVSEEEQETAPEGQKPDDGRIYVDGALYNGYYMDASGKMYKVTNGAGELKIGTLNVGVKYYSNKAGKMQTLSKQTLYVNGKAYTGYYLGKNNKMYGAAKGSYELKTGTMSAGAKYYSYSAKKTQTLSKRKLYVNGKAYTGYYLGKNNKMYGAAKGSYELKTGTLSAGTKYYSYSAKKTQTLSKRKLYVSGKAYTGYYLGKNNKIYGAAKGSYTLKTGTLSAGTKYYSYNAKKTRTLSKRKLYVSGKAYTGYYLGKNNKMYRVNKGALTLETGELAAGTKYYSYSAKKVQALSNQTLYVNGKAYTGYYLGSDNMMYGASNGACVLVNTALDAGTPYYSYHAGTVQTLPAMMVYVNGKAMEGMSAESLVTLQRAQAIVNSITNDSMTKKEKLSVCFDFVKNYTEINPRIPHYKGMDWPIVYANDMFVNGAGNCCSYASALAYMAKAIGYEEVYCCNSGGHGWAEIDGLVYDPEWSKHHHIYSYYALSYDTPTDQAYKGAIAAGLPWMRIKI